MSWKIAVKMFGRRKKLALIKDSFDRKKKTTTLDLNRRCGK